tara:strand:- start:844 stop:1341 length:498 start_codon:yes stop_codon:yes gene_type:complete
LSGYGPIAVEMARYNKWQNDKLYAAVADLPPDEVTRARGMFFGDMLATLDHMLMVEGHLLDYIHGRDPGAFDANRRIETAFGPLRVARAAADTKMIAMCEAATPQWFDEEIVMPSGRRPPRSFWWAQLFNHATHHRSQVTSELTHMGVDYGNTDMPYNPLTQFGV